MATSITFRGGAWLMEKERKKIMEKSEVHKKSILLLGKFIANTPESEINELIEKCKSLNIKGPTYSEYLESFGRHIDN